MAKRKENTESAGQSQQTEVKMVSAPNQSQPAADETKAVAEAETGQNQPADEEVKRKEDSDPGQSQPAIDEAKAPLQEKQKYKIICRNPVSKEIGGVTFVNGVGYTDDGFTASWFRNRGYEVSAV